MPLDGAGAAIQKEDIPRTLASLNEALKEAESKEGESVYFYEIAGDTVEGGPPELSKDTWERGAPRQQDGVFESTYQVESTLKNRGLDIYEIPVDVSQEQFTSAIDNVRNRIDYGRHEFGTTYPQSFGKPRGIKTNKEVYGGLSLFLASQYYDKKPF
jgi:hypothetical protein